MPPHTNIDAFRDALIDRRNTREPLHQTLLFLNELIVAHGGRPIGLRTLKRQLSAWGIARATAGHNLEALYEDICDLYYEGLKIQEIHIDVNFQLQQCGLSTVSERTLYAQLERWGLNTRHEAVNISEELIRRVKHYVFNFGFSDSSILRDLQREGFQVNLWVIRQIRYRHGMKRRARTDEEKEATLNYAQGDRLDSCHIYGPSTRNVRIESWWRQLRRGATDRWISFFSELAGYALFKENTIADQIAIYAIYGPIIRDELAKFVDLWNGHIIRNQRNRPNVKAGIPMDLYHTTEAPNWGVPLSEDDNSPDQQLLRDMIDPLAHLDIDTLLPEETEAWCNQRLQEIGFQARLDLQDDFKRPFVEEYIQLRDIIERHQETGNQPILQLTPIHTGGAKEYERLLQRNYATDPSLVGDSLPSAFHTQVAEAHRGDFDLE